MNENDQARRLRELTRDLPSGAFLRRLRKRPPPRIISIASGRGGVGKTFLALNLSLFWTLRGKKTLLVDADYSMGHVDYLLGLNPKFTIQHLIEQKVDYDSVLMDGPWGLRLIPGMAGEISRLVPDNRIKELIPDIAMHDDWADFLVCDTTSGIGRPTYDILASSTDVLLITTPESASVMDLYSVIKYVSSHLEDRAPRMHVIINRLATRDEGRRVAASLRGVTGRFLGKGLNCIGMIPSDRDVEEASRKHIPFIRHSPISAASRAIEEVAFRLLDQWGDPLTKS